MAVCGVEIQREPLDPERIRRAIEHVDLGGVVVFCGEVRARTGDAVTENLDYEAYEAMAVAQMRKIGEEAVARWRANVFLSHRIGRLLPGEIAVVTAAACAHRAEAFDCCRYLIDRIKEDVPIWKRE